MNENTTATSPAEVTNKDHPMWKRECLYWRGRELTGKFAHWCDDWDGLPIDETTPEWQGCTCFGESADEH